MYFIEAAIRRPSYRSSAYRSHLGILGCVVAFNFDVVGEKSAINYLSPPPKVGLLSGRAWLGAESKYGDAGRYDYAVGHV